MIDFIIMVSMQTFFIALADRTRRRILNLMREQEICVHFFTEVLDISQPKISRHLAYLRNAELVKARREGKLMFYRIIEPEDFHANQILQDTLDWLASQERMQKDYEKLREVSLSSTALTANNQIFQTNILRETHTSFEKTEEMEIYLL